MIEYIIILFSMIFLLGFIYLFYVVIAYYIDVYSEQKAYQKMIMNLTDASVLKYLERYKKVGGFMDTWISIINSSYIFLVKQRQAQGFRIVNESSAISADVKARLRIAYISKGVLLTAGQIIDNKL